MTIQDWGAIGEIIGAIAVVASLLYLAIQIKTSNRAAQQAELQEIVMASNQVVGQISSNTETSDLWLRGHAHNPNLSDAELVQFRFLLWQFVIIWQRVYELNKSKSLPNYILKSASASRRNMMSSPGFQAWYENAKHMWSDDFIEFLESEMKKSAESYRPFGVESKIQDKADT